MHSHLGFRDNELEAFPEGLADELPQLSVVNLQRNKLTTVDEKAVAPLKDRTVFVNFAGKLRWTRISISFA